MSHDMRADAEGAFACGCRSDCPLHIAVPVLLDVLELLEQFINPEVCQRLRATLIDVIGAEPREAP